MCRKKTTTSPLSKTLCFQSRIYSVSSKFYPLNRGPRPLCVSLYCHLSRPYIPRFIIFTECAALFYFIPWYFHVYMFYDQNREIWPNDYSVWTSLKVQFLIKSPFGHVSLLAATQWSKHLTLTLPIIMYWTCLPDYYPIQYLVQLHWTCVIFQPRSIT